MSDVPCGRGTMHEGKCVEGHMCSSCRTIQMLREDLIARNATISKMKSQNRETMPRIHEVFEDNRRLTEMLKDYRRKRNDNNRLRKQRKKHKAQIERMRRFLEMITKLDSQEGLGQIQLWHLTNGAARALEATDGDV